MQNRHRFAKEGGAGIFLVARSTSVPMPTKKCSKVIITTLKMPLHFVHTKQKKQCMAIEGGVDIFLVAVCNKLTKDKNLINKK